MKTKPTSVLQRVAALERDEDRWTAFIALTNGALARADLRALLALARAAARWNARGKSLYEHRERGKSLYEHREACDRLYRAVERVTRRSDR